MELHIPNDELEMQAKIRELHEVLKEKLESHIDANGHSISEHDPSHILEAKVRYSTLLGEMGATYYLRRKFNPEPQPNWAIHHEEIMDAFYEKHSIKAHSTIIATKCGTEWVHDSKVVQAT